MNKIIRTDILYSPKLNHNKESRVIDFICEMRKLADPINRAIKNWFYKNGEIPNNNNMEFYNEFIKGKNAKIKNLLRFDIIGAYKSWLSNRKNDINDIISSYDIHRQTKFLLFSKFIKEQEYDEVSYIDNINIMKKCIEDKKELKKEIEKLNKKYNMISDKFKNLENSELILSRINDDLIHQLRSINIQLIGKYKHLNDKIQLFYGKGKDKKEITADAIEIYKSISRFVFSKNRMPSVGQLQLGLQDQFITISPANNPSEGIDYWLRINAIKTSIPLQSYDYHESREGIRLNTIKLILDKEHKLKYGILTDITSQYTNSKTSYVALCDSIGLDWGLKSALFATSTGELLGRDFYVKLKEYDHRIVYIAKKQQENKTAPRKSEKYREYITSLRGYIKTEINRILVSYIERIKPKKIIIENLDFRGSNLSKRLNRLLSNYGRKYIDEKLNDFEQKYGIEIIRVNPAYSSQTCSQCGYVDKKNRPNQQDFHCRWCGMKLHADVNGARNIANRGNTNQTFWSSASFTSKAKALRATINSFLERYDSQPKFKRAAELRICDKPRDLCDFNNYFRDFFKDRKEAESLKP